jgi:hypothetical protein
LMQFYGCGHSMPITLSRTDNQERVCGNTSAHVPSIYTPTNRKLW